jgi:beta-lactamase class A
MPTTKARHGLEEKVDRLRQHFSGQLSVAARNLTTGDELLADPDRLYPTASTIKIAILIELHAQAQEGKLSLAEKLAVTQGNQVGGSGVLRDLADGAGLSVRDLGTLMMTVSDNTATNLLIDRVGGVAAVNKRLHDGLGLDTIALHRRIDFDEIGDDVRRFAEATPRDLMRLMEMLLRGQAVSKQVSEAVLAVMRRQQYLEFVPRYLQYTPWAAELGLNPPITVANKPGFLAGTGVDAGALFLPDGVEVACCVMAHGSRDLSHMTECEPAIACGIVGRWLVEEWWPGGDLNAAILESPYFALMTE